MHGSQRFGIASSFSRRGSGGGAFVRAVRHAAGRAVDGSERARRDDAHAAGERHPAREWQGRRTPPQARLGNGRQGVRKGRVLGWKLVKSKWLRGRVCGGVSKTRYAP